MGTAGANPSMLLVMGFISGFGDSWSNLIQKVWHSVMFGGTTALTESLMGFQTVPLSPSQVSHFYVDQRTLLSQYLVTRCIPTPRPPGITVPPPWYLTQVPILISEICLYICNSTVPPPLHKASKCLSCDSASKEIKVRKTGQEFLF